MFIQCSSSQQQSRLALRIRKASLVLSHSSASWLSRAESLVNTGPVIERGTPYEPIYFFSGQPTTDSRLSSFIVQCDGTVPPSAGFEVYQDDSIMVW